jgi:hypothetical protein
MKPAIPTGTLTKKIQGQENVCVRKRRDDRERGRRDQRGAEALQRPKADQHPGRAREPVQQRGDREDDQPDQEDALAPEQVAGSPAEQQETSEEQRVRVDDPLQVGLAQAEVLLDRRQRDVHDRRVEDDHELRDADQDQDEPGVRGVATAHGRNLAIESELARA